MYSRDMLLGKYKTRNDHQVVIGTAYLLGSENYPSQLVKLDSSKCMVNDLLTSLREFAEDFGCTPVILTGEFVGCDSEMESAMGCLDAAMTCGDGDGDGTTTTSKIKTTTTSRCPKENSKAKKAKEGCGTLFQTDAANVLRLTEHRSSRVYAMNVSITDLLKGIMMGPAQGALTNSVALRACCGIPCGNDNNKGNKKGGKTTSTTTR